MAAATSKVSQEIVEKAVNALVKWKEDQSKSMTPRLLPEDDFIYLVLTLYKIPPKDNGLARTNPYKIPLPHPLFLPNSFSDLCLIIDDRPSSNLASDFAKKKIKSENIPVSKVIKLSKLKSDYKPFEAKRKLCDSYDMFFADKRVVPFLPKLLGKHFFKKKKLPLPVELTHKNWKEQIERACSSALLRFKTGTCSVVRVGKVSMEKQEIVENVGAAVDGIVQIVSKKWGEIRSLHLKFSESLALPIYQALPTMKMKIEGVKKNLEGVEEESGGNVLLEDERKKGEKLEQKKGSKKGRIHEVRYMDCINSEDLGSEIDGGDDKDENGEMGSDVFGSKKRKNEDSSKREGKKNKKGAKEEIGKGGLGGRHVDDSGGKKAEKNSILATTKNSTRNLKVKKNKKQSSM